MVKLATGEEDTGRIVVLVDSLDSDGVLMDEEKLVYFIADLFW